jgi:carboxyl-terminal processing protease
MEAGRVGVLRINSFADGEAADAKARLQDLIKQGAQKVVIDLRDTAGGSLTEAVTVANLFIKDGVIAETVGREGKALKTFTADPKATLFSGPVVALIDAGTAEQLKLLRQQSERNRGQLVGERVWRWSRTTTVHTTRWRWFVVDHCEVGHTSGKPFLGEDRAHSGSLLS